MNICKVLIPKVERTPFNIIFLLCEQAEMSLYQLFFWGFLVLAFLTGFNTVLLLIMFGVPVEC